MQFSAEILPVDRIQLVINEKTGSTLHSKYTSIKGIPCFPSTLTQPLLQDGMRWDSGSPQEQVSPSCLGTKSCDALFPLKCHFPTQVATHTSKPHFSTFWSALLEL